MTWVQAHMSSSTHSYDRTRLCLAALASQTHARADAVLKLLLTKGLPAVRTLVAAWWRAAQCLLRRLGLALRNYVAQMRAGLACPGGRAAAGGRIAAAALRLWIALQAVLRSPAVRLARAALARLVVVRVSRGWGAARISLLDGLVRRGPALQLDFPGRCTRQGLSLCVQTHPSRNVCARTGSCLQSLAKSGSVNHSFPDMPRFLAVMCSSPCR